MEAGRPQGLWRGSGGLGARCSGLLLPARTKQWECPHFPRKEKETTGQLLSAVTVLLYMCTLTCDL